ncbi:hypothetical protein [Sediminibacterium sp.]|jgi:hypothetical protein|uniref:hypothetical protein n=1 Tax=Sediminibacterium sp. TaxID=1917865 RepID=UPI003F6E5BE0
MKKIEYKLLPKITEEIIQNRFSCFSESLNYYKDLDSTREVYDENSFHLVFYIDGKFAGYTRLTPCPYNYMNHTSKSKIEIPNDDYTFEMGRTFVLPEFRGIKLVSLILLVGLHISETLGYKKAIGNESYEAHLKMPTANGWEFMNIIADFHMPFSNKGYHTFYLIQCDLKKTKEFRRQRILEFKKWFADNNYEFELF